MEYEKKKRKIFGLNSYYFKARPQNARKQGLKITLIILKRKINRIKRE
jgi:hypothetical protein